VQYLRDPIEDSIQSRCRAESRYALGKFIAHPQRGVTQWRAPFTRFIGPAIESDLPAVSSRHEQLVTTFRARCPILPHHDLEQRSAAARE